MRLATYPVDADESVALELSTVLGVVEPLGNEAESPSPESVFPAFIMMKCVET